MSERERSQSRTTSVGGDDKAELRLLWRRVLLRLSVLYFLPFLILTVFFHMQYRALGRSSERSNLHSLALRQATALDVALLQRLRESQGSAPELDREVMEALLAQTRVEVEGYRFSVSGDHFDSQGELSDAQQRSEAAFLLPP